MQLLLPQRHLFLNKAGEIKNRKLRLDIELKQHTDHITLQFAITLIFSEYKCSIISI